MNWHKYFTYDDATGNLIWKARPVEDFRIRKAWLRWNTIFPSKIAGHFHSRGYVRIKIDGKFYEAHRIIVEMHDGPLLPKQQVDHVDGNSRNNKRPNLRRCSHAQNTMNSGKRSDNTSGYKGVHCSADKWSARIQVNRSRKFLGLFDTPELAHAAYCEAAAKHHGEFARTA